MAGKKGITRTKHVDGKARPASVTAFGKQTTPSTINGGNYPLAYQRNGDLGPGRGPTWQKYKYDSTVKPYEIPERKAKVPTAHRRKK